MPLALLLALSLIFWPLQPDLSLNGWSQPFHNWCLNQLPESQFRPLYAALTCGADLNQGEWSTLFKVAGLYHILVVSGAHLMFISLWLKPISRDWYGALALVAILFFYVLMANGQPPIFRAWLQILLVLVSRSRRWNWRGPIVVLVSGLLCLRFFPHWSHSLSFWLSWMASVATSWIFRNPRGTFRKTIMLHLLLTPISVTFGSFHPICLILNWTIAPILGQILLPLCGLSALFPSVVFFTDRIWELLIRLLEQTQTVISSTPLPVSKSQMIGYVLVLQFFWLFWNQNRLRRD